jgi:hypothetical protein
VSPFGLGTEVRGLIVTVSGEEDCVRAQREERMGSKYKPY